MELKFYSDGSLQKLDETIETLIKNGMKAEDTTEIRWDLIFSKFFFMCP